MNKHKVLGLWSVALALVLFPLLAWSSGSGTLTLTNSVDNGDQTHTLTVSSTSSLTVGDHFGARITGSTGPGGVWTITSIVDATSVIVTDNLYDLRGSGVYWGAPIAGDAWYSTPTSGEALSSPPHNAKAWDGALARNYYVVAAAVTSRINADGTTPLTANWDVGDYTVTAKSFTSDVVTGTAPFQVASTTVVTNLNADTVDGQSPGTIFTQDASAVAITGGSVVGITDLAVADGGTGSSTASDARTALGLGTMATQGSSSVSITGGSVAGITDLAVADGGTGASTAAAARTNLGVLSLTEAGIGQRAIYTASPLAAGVFAAYGAGPASGSFTESGISAYLETSTSGGAGSYSYSGSTSGDDAGVTATGGPQFYSSSAPLQFQCSVDFYCRFRVGEITNTRVFVGLSETSGPNMDADAPAYGYAGMQFSTVRPDTNWKFVAADGTGTQVITDTAVGASTSELVVRVQLAESTGYATMTLYNADMSRVLAGPTQIAAPVDYDGQLNLVAVATTQSASQKNFYFYRFHMEVF